MGVVRLLRTPSSPDEPERTGPSDGMLVLEARRGTMAAQEALFRRHVRRVVGLAHRLLSGSGEDVDDLVQDAFVQALNKLGELREPEAFGGWLGQIVVRTASKRLRRRRLLTRLGLLRNEEVDLDGFAVLSLPQDKAMELRELYQDLLSFPAEERIALTLRRVEGMETEDIASSMGLSASTVKRRLKRAEGRIERLRERRLGS
jgi:RNA polymerase sigma-70 factor (ECF subfamily)